MSNGELAQMEAAKNHRISVDKFSQDFVASKHIFSIHTAKEVLDDAKEYVVLSLTDYKKLRSIIEATAMENRTVIDSETFLFLSLLWGELNVYAEPEPEVAFEVFNNTCHIMVDSGRYRIIDSTFSLDLCKKYGKDVRKFIDEVL
jgi:hypothetical protein